MPPPSESASSSGSSAGNWSQLAHDLLRSSQEDSDETLACEACRTESSVDGSSNGNVDGMSQDHVPQTPKSWWAELIKIHSSEFGCIESLPKITVVSACAGIFAEGETLKAGWCAN